MNLTSEYHFSRALIGRAFLSLFIEENKLFLKGIFTCWVYLKHLFLSVPSVNILWNTCYYFDLHFGEYLLNNQWT